MKTSKLKLILMLLLLINCSNKKQDKFLVPIQIKDFNNYTLVYNFPLNGEVKINDIVIDKSLYNMLDSTEFINNYILESGETTIAIEMVHPFYEKGGNLISNTMLTKVSEDFAIYNTLYDSNDIIDVKLVQNLTFDEISNPLPLVKRAWKVDLDVPYKIIGWSQSEDLTKWDADLLEKEIVKKYKDLVEILNNGNGEKMLEELVFANKELFTTNNFSEQKQSEYLKNLKDDFSLQKGLINTLDDYSIKIMGNGKVVALEKKLGKFKGQGILTTIDEKNKELYCIYIMLHKPYNSNNFEIVRYFCTKTAL